MRYTSPAKILGRRGGLARARRLSPKQRKAIASLGARARTESFRGVRKIDENFRYLEAVLQIKPSPFVRALKKCRNKLPGIYG